MSLDAALSEAVRSAVAPLVSEVAAVRAELTALRAAQAPRLVSPAEAAKALGISIATCRRRILDGSIPARHIGRRVVCDLSTVRPTDAPTAVRLAAEARQP